MELGLRGKIAIVTGAGGGIGEAIAKTLAREGVKVVIAELDEHKGSQVASCIKSDGGEALSFPVDVSKKEQVESLVQVVIQKFGRVDILVNNAGFCSLTPLEEVREEEWERMLNVNLKGPFNFSQTVLKYMKKQKYGKIINIASVAGKDGGVVSPHYSISKAGVICLTKCFAKYGAQYGINVNTISPGPAATEMTKDWPDSLKQERLSRTPLGRFAEPGDIAGMAVFLASDVTGHMTGANIDINGGILMD